PRFDRLDQIRGLRRRTAGVSGGEPGGVGARRQVVDERGDVHAGDRTTVFGADGDGVGAGDHPFPTVAGDVWVDTPFESAQQGGLAVVAATDDDRDPLGNAHTGHRPPARQLEVHAERLRTGERGRPLDPRQVGVAGTAGEYRTVADEGHEGSLRESGAQLLLVEEEFDVAA